MVDSDEDYYNIPIHDQRVYGAGIKRKRIHFVRASKSTQSAPPSPTLKADEPTLAEHYIQSYRAVRSDDDTETSRLSPRTAQICDLCGQPIRDLQGAKGVPHETTISHQIALKHSFGPATIDRHSKGLPYMQAQGWDPDSRQGLGATGEGILHPIEAKERKERLGLGIKVKPKSLHTRCPAEVGVKKHQNLNARQMQKLDAEEKKRAEHMRDLFYRDEKVENLLGNLDRKAIPNKKPIKSKQKNTEAREETSRGRWV